MERNSKLILAKNIKLDKEYNNVLNYNTEKMLQLLNDPNHIVVSYTDFSFIRSSINTINVPLSYDKCLGANYMAFQNPMYSNKWFFAFIDNIEFVSDQDVKITFTVDVWSTWWSEWHAATCFVEREHVNDDTIGANTIEENLNVGRLIQEDEYTDDSLGNDFYVAIQTAWIPKDGSNGEEALEKDKGKQYDGISIVNRQVFGTKVCLIDINNIDSFKNLVFFIFRTNADAHINDIENIFIVPKKLFNPNLLEEHKFWVSSVYEVTYYTPRYTLAPISYVYTVPKKTSFSDYKPKNNKCLCFPYNYLFVSNNVGNQNIYKFEDFFSPEVASFEIDLAFSIGVSGRLIPTNFKNMNADYDESISLAKYPTCGWSADSYTNWLTKESVNNVTNMTMSLVGAGTNYNNANYSIANSKASETQKYHDLLGVNVSTGIGIAQGIANTIGAFRSAQLAPNITGGQNTGDVNFSSGKNTFIFRHMRANTENMKIIDDYFSRFGYAINRMKVPNLYGRKEFNFVKIGSGETIGYGSVPSSYMTIINTAAQKGVTIWHNHESIGNYNILNPIV